MTYFPARIRKSAIFELKVARRVNAELIRGYRTPMEYENMKKRVTTVT